MKKYLATGAIVSLYYRPLINKRAKESENPKTVATLCAGVVVLTWPAWAMATISDTCRYTYRNLRSNE